MRWICLALACALLAGCGGRRPRPVAVEPPRSPQTEAPASAPPAPPAPRGVRPEVRRPSEPFPATAAETAPAPSLAERIAELNGRLRDVHFAYDRSDLSNESLAVLDDNSGLLKPMLAEFPGLVIAVEGHCDERGSAEYNLGLGDRRAAGVSEHLQKLGVAAGRLRTISYGKETPLCTEPTEACHARNRRAHFAARAADAP